VETIVGEIRRHRTRRNPDLGGGANHSALPSLECLEAIDYLGSDRSAAMVSVFQRINEARYRPTTGLEFRAVHAPT
jgi:hypothetical protein